jgi:hypothetical protein
MIKTLDRFAALLLQKPVENHVVQLDPTHTITMAVRDNGNALFDLHTKIGDEVIILSSIELEPYTRNFWNNLAAALGALHYGATITTATVMAVVSQLSQEDLIYGTDRDRPSEPSVFTKKRKRQTDGTVQSTNMAKSKFPKEC